MVSAANPYAVKAAVAILEKGGSATDAAIAAHLVLGLVEPQSSGLGGGGFMLNFDFKTNDLTFIDGRETAPSSAKIDMFMKDDGTVMSFMEAVPSGKAVGTPGIVALYETAHKAYGLLPWNVLFKDAIDLANNGFIVSPRLASYVELAEKRGRLSKNPLTKKYFYPNDVKIKNGDLLKNFEYAKSLNIDVIIIDHHKPDEESNEFYSLVNPNSTLDTSGYGFLCSAGLVYIFLNYLNNIIKLDSFRADRKVNIKDYLDLVALATVCDVVPLINLNRAFVFEGLKILSKRKNLGLKILSDESQLEKKPDEEDLGFFFGPRLNAGGRVGKSSIGEELLSIKDEEEAEIIAKQLNTLNYQRKLIEEKVFTEAIDQINSNNIEKKNFILVYSDIWHEGVLGIVASRIKEKFQKPVIVLTKDNNLNYKGSGRSILGVDIGNLIIQAKKKNILIKGGGHSMAAGLTLEKSKIEEFDKFCSNYVLRIMRKKNEDKVLKFDEVLSLNSINDDLYNSIKSIAPFGEGNPKPKFLFNNIKIIKPTLIGNPKKHLSFFISDNSSKSIKAILFNANDNLLGKTILSNHKKNLFSFIGFINKTYWRNKVYFEAIIEDGVLEKVII